VPPLTWLIDCAGVPSDAQLHAFATYGQGLGPDKVRSSWCCAAVAAAIQIVFPARAMFRMMCMSVLDLLASLLCVAQAQPFDL